MIIPGDRSSSPAPPSCAPSMERLQRFLDGELPASALASDAHAPSCEPCRQRISAARLVHFVLSSTEAPTLPSGLTDSVLAAVEEGRYSRLRGRAFAVVGGAVIAVAASLLLVTWLTNRGPQPGAPAVIGSTIHPELANAIPRAPVPRPARLGDEFAKVGQVIVDSSKPITLPDVVAPDVLGLITDSIALPAAPPSSFEPTRVALAELPEAARTGLEPLTSTTQRAFARLIRDVGGVQISAKPKS